MPESEGEELILAGIKEKYFLFKPNGEII